IITQWGYLCESTKTIQSDLKKIKPYNFSGVPLVVETIYDRVWKTARKTGREEILKKGIKISRFLMKLGIDRRRKIFKTIHDNLGGNLDMIVCGGANLDPKYEKGMYDFGIDVYNGYGLTECSPAITCNRPGKFKFGSVGVPLDCCEIKIHEPDADGVGEIYVKGVNVMVGYYNDPEATKEAFDGEWFKTGDFGRIDEDGFLFTIGRKKNLIVLSNGKNVSPEELEDKLSRIEYVSEVLVYEENRKITAEFFLNEEDFPDARSRIKGDVDEFNRSMPLFKNVNSIKIRTEEFPKTTTLKIVRKNMQK
ncbi:MAG: AMP-binding protein, partial [Clostridia bacterium]|nr:AMP-binding protein [Clostridia bacterium]